MSKIREFDQVNDIIVGNSELSVIVQDADTALPEIMEVLRQRSVPARRVSLTRPTLDDVFLKYAGTRLESGGGISDVRRVGKMIRRG